MITIDLTNKNAVVCGSTQGIGLATAQQMAMAGATVTLVARNKEKLEEALQTLDTKVGQVHNYIVADFAQPVFLQEKIEEWAETHACHILVNNTGGPAAGKAIDAEPMDYVNAFKQHLLCNQILVQALSKAMKEHGYGRIINIISTSVKQPLKGLGVSNTIRGAVASWAKTLAMELGPFGITVNNVLPGATSTERLETIIQNKSKNSGADIDKVTQEMLAEIPAGRFGNPTEIANAVTFLASPLAAYINGINVPVDGGRTGCL